MVLHSGPNTTPDSASSSQHPLPVEVTASLSRQLPNPYSSLCLSPDQTYAVTACKDTLQLLRLADGEVTLVKTTPVGHHFDPSRMNRTIQDQQQSQHHSSPFSVFASQPQQQQSGMVPSLPRQHHQLHLVLTDVAWNCVSPDDNSNSSLIAAAGSNGVIVVWQASSFLNLSVPMPEVILTQHTRAVNRLTWHPSRPDLLCSGGQDGVVLLWQRMESEEGEGLAATDAEEQNSKTSDSTDPTSRSKEGSSSSWSLFFMGKGKRPEMQPSSKTTTPSTVSWQQRGLFEPKSEAVRDVQWNTTTSEDEESDLLALVTTSGSLIIYHCSLPRRALVKLTAHAGDATTVAWHPEHWGVVATGGASDRCVKLWDLGDKLLSSLPLLDRKDGIADSTANLVLNQNTTSSRGTVSESTEDRTTGSGSENSASLCNSHHGRAPGSPGSSSYIARRGGSGGNNSVRHLWHTLSIGAAVTRLLWRPPLHDSTKANDMQKSLLAVATAPVQGASSGGAGHLGLWSWHRPFMPLSVVMGHSEGAVTDFCWLQEKQPMSQILLGRGICTANKIHVLTVGRDGRCLIQDMGLGDRPLTRVPPSSFSLANLSPFQSGCGSLQLMSVCQPVTSSTVDETPESNIRDPCLELLNSVNVTSDPWKPPSLNFHVIDQGNLIPKGGDKIHLPDAVTIKGRSAIAICPEVLHMSRFAKRYRYCYSEEFQDKSTEDESRKKQRVKTCRHNADVAASLGMFFLEEVWKLVALVLEQAGTDGLKDSGSDSCDMTVMQFVLQPTVKSLLEERSIAGDVQTCVSVCEVLRVVSSTETVRIPGLELELVREWYLTYIDLLRDMCLFAEATHLIRNCEDPFISALNKQSTT